MLFIDLENYRTTDKQFPYDLEICESLRYGTERNFLWKRSINGPDGRIYFPYGRMTCDGGRTITECDEMFASDCFGAESTYISRPGFFFMLIGHLRYAGQGELQTNTLMSQDNFKTFKKSIASIFIPDMGNYGIEAGQASSLEAGTTFGAKNIVELPDGRLLATMYGCFAEDRLEPSDVSSKLEIKYKARSFVVESKDLGQSWQYLSTIAKTEDGDPIGEGFNETTIIQLDTGELMCVIRTGHFSPLFCSWSTDGGITWTNPIYMGVDRACAPSFLKMADGRLALVYGQRYPAGNPLRDELGTPMTDVSLLKEICFSRSLVKLAISPDGRGRQWFDMTVGCGKGSTYATLHEVEPNVLLCQVDGECWRIRM